MVSLDVKHHVYLRRRRRRRSRRRKKERKKHTITTIITAISIARYLTEKGQQHRALRVMNNSTCWRHCFVNASFALLKAINRFDVFTVLRQAGCYWNGRCNKHHGRLLLLLLQCCFTSTETVRTIRDGEPRTSTSTFTQLLNSLVDVQVQCCFTSAETVRTIRDGKPRTATRPPQSSGAV